MKSKLQEFNKLSNILPKEELEIFAQNVLLNMDKQASLLSAGKGLFNANFKIQKTMFMNPVGGLMLAKPVLTGEKNIGDTVKETLIPGYNEGKGALQDIKDTNFQTKMNPEMVTPINKLPKVAYTQEEIVTQDITNAPVNTSQIIPSDRDNSSSNLLAGLGLAAVGGGAGYLGFNKAYNYLTAKPQFSEGVASGLNRGISQFGREFSKKMTKGKPITGLIGGTAAESGNVLGRLEDKNNYRTNFSTLTGKPSAMDNVKSVGKYMGILTAGSIVEDYLTSRFWNTVNAAKEQKLIPEREERQYTPRTPYVKKAYTPYVKKPYVAGEEKVAGVNPLTPTAKRMTVENLLKPALNNVAFLLPISVGSALLGRNIYGSMEHLNTVPNTASETSGPAPQQMIIDVPNSSVLELNKSASPTSNFINKVLGKAETAPVGFIERTNAKLNNWIESDTSPGIVKKLDSFIVEGNKGYDGKKGLAHYLTEELPAQSLKGVAYTVPIAMLAASINRNPRRGFEPVLDTTTNYPVGYTQQPSDYDPNTTRIVIQEKVATTVNQVSPTLEAVLKEQGASGFVLPPAVVGLSDDAINVINQYMLRKNKSEMEESEKSTNEK